MPYGTFTAFYGFLTFATVAYAYRSGVKSMFGASLILLIAWTLSALSFHRLAADHPLYYPAIDFVLGSALVMQGWKAKDHVLYGLACLFLADFIIHIGYFTSSDHSYSARWYYDLKLNLVYLRQLGYVSGVCYLSRRGGTEVGGLN